MSAPRFPTGPDRPGYPECVSAATLAAYVDGRLHPSDRARVDAHIAECADCREALIDVTEATTDLATHAGPSLAAVSARPARRVSTVVGLLAAAVIFIAAGLGGWQMWRASAVNRALGRLVDAVGTNRFSEARLGEAFQHGAVPSPLRGRPTEPPAAVEHAIVDLAELAERHPTADSLRGAGVASLARGDVDAAVASIGEAVRLAPNDATANADLSAALLERWRRNGDSGDASTALNHATLALEADPKNRAAQFNSALAFEAMQMRQAAIAAWQRVVATESGSEWGLEAAQHLARLKQQELALARVPDVPTPDELTTLVRERPGALFARLDELIGAWARDHPTGDGDLPAAAGAIASALRTSDLDRTRVEFVDAVRAAPHHSAAQRACLADALPAEAQARERFRNSDYTGSRQLALRAAQSARCAGIPAEPFLGLAAYASFWTTGERSASLVEARGIEQAAAAHHEWFTAGRMHYLQAIDAIAGARLTDGFAQWEQARLFARQSGDPDLMATSAALLGEAYREAGEFDRAWTLHVESFAHLPDITPRAAHIVLINATITAQRRHEGGLALALSRLLVENGERWSNPAGRIRAQMYLGYAYHELGRNADAMRAIDAAKSLQAATDDTQITLSDLSMADGLIRQQVDPAAAIRALTTARQLLVETPLRQPTILLWRSRSQQVLGDRHQANADLEAARAILEDQRASLRTEQLRLSRLDQTWDVYGDLIDLDRHDPLAALEVAEGARGRALLDSLAHGQTLVPLRGADLFTSVPANTTAIVYAALKDRLLIWIVTHDGVRLVDRPISADALQTLVDTFVRELPTGRTTANARSLASIVWPEEVRLAANRRIAFLPDGPLYRLPFGALPVGPSGGALADSAVSVVAPSLTLMSRVPNAVTGTHGKVVLIGYGKGRPGEDLPQLPAVDREIADLAKLYPSAVTLRDADATPSRIVVALDHASIVHFSGHAIADEVYPSLSKLFVAADTDGRDALTPDAIAATHLQPGAVVVLAACDTARGRVVRGEGAMSLARPFLVAGASAVVASLWRVRDDEAREVLQEWHRRLATGRESPAEALAVTQRHWLADRGSTAAFAFELIGSDWPSSETR